MLFILLEVEAIIAVIFKIVKYCLIFAISQADEIHCTFCTMDSQDKLRCNVHVGVVKTGLTRIEPKTK